MAQQHMLDRVREKFTALLNGYLPVPDVRDYIVTPAVAGNGSATLGNFVLAKSVANKHKNEVGNYPGLIFSLFLFSFPDGKYFAKFRGGARCWYEWYHRLGSG